MSNTWTTWTGWTGRRSKMGDSINNLSQDTSNIDTCNKSQYDSRWVEFWRDQNKKDGAIGLYCQSCCYRYPSECDFIDTIHPYDRCAETCPDFIPKDYYKPKNKAKCLKLRLSVDPQYSPLPECDLPHPLRSPFFWCDNVTYYKIMTKIKARGGF